MACKVCALIAATQSVASPFLQAKLPQAGGFCCVQFLWAAEGWGWAASLPPERRISGQHQVIQHSGKAGEPWLCLQLSLCWQIHSPAHACGSFSRSQFLYSQVAFNLPINSCKNILSYVTNLGPVSRFQVAVKGTWGQPSSVSLWDVDRKMHRGPSDVLPQPVLSRGAAGTAVGQGRSHGMSSVWIGTDPQLHEANGWCSLMTARNVPWHFSVINPAPGCLSLAFLPFLFFFSIPFLSLLHSWSEETPVCQKAATHTQPMCSGEFPSAQAVPEDALSGPYPIHGSLHEASALCGPGMWFGINAAILGLC